MFCLTPLFLLAEFWLISFTCVCAHAWVCLQACEYVCVCFHDWRKQSMSMTDLLDFRSLTASNPKLAYILVIGSRIRVYELNESKSSVLTTDSTERTEHYVYITVTQTHCHTHTHTQSLQHLHHKIYIRIFTYACKHTHTHTITCSHTHANTYKH